MLRFLSVKEDNKLKAVQSNATDIKTCASLMVYWSEANPRGLEIGWASLPVSGDTIQKANGRW